MSPTYVLRCGICGDFEQWASIRTGPDKACPDCGRDVVQVMSPPQLYAIGARGEATKDIDARERALVADLGAYKSLRHQGYQPQRIDGAARLESHAQSEMEINSGGVIKGPDREIKASIELARGIMAGEV